MLKIVHIETGLHLYGGALQVKFLIEGLVRQGVHNTLICTQGSAIADVFADHPEVDVIPSTCRGDLDVQFIFAVLYSLKTIKPDVVHLHSRRGADVLGGVAARLAGIPAVLSRRVDNHEPRWWAAIKYRLYRQVITISEAIEQVLLTAGVPSAKLQCVHSSVDTHRYQPVPQPEAFNLFCQQHKIPEGQRYVAMLAQFILRKGHDYFVEQIPAILEAHPDVVFVLFGQGPRHESVQAKVARLGLVDRVKLPGFVERIDQLLPSFTAVVHPAYQEGLGVSLLQAAACAVPIVAARAGGIPEVARDGVNALLFEPGDGHQLKNHLVNLLSDTQQQQILGQAGRALIEQHFSPAQMVAGNLAVYHDVINST